MFSIFVKKVHLKGQSVMLKYALKYSKRIIILTTVSVYVHGVIIFALEKVISSN